MENHNKATKIKSAEKSTGKTQMDSTENKSIPREIQRLAVRLSH
jgi:hypothetical protein